MVHDPDNDGNETEHRADIDANNDGDVADASDTDWDGDSVFDSGAYLVDPVGRALATNPASLGLLPRFHGISAIAANAVPTIAQFEALAMLPDIWQPIFQSRVASQNNGTFTISIPSGTDLTNLTTGQVRNTANPNNPRYRMVLLDSTGKNAAIKDLFQITDNAGTANDDLIWQDTTSPTTLPLPSGFTATNVKVEAQERRYTWLLTVRKNSGGTTAVDVVAFFERSFRAQDEFVYGDPANAGTSAAYSVNSAGQATSNGYDGDPGVSGVDDDSDGTTDNNTELGWPGSDDRRTIAVSWTPGSDPQPFIKQGGFLLDTVAGNWYRVVQYTESTTAGTASIVVDRDLVPFSTGISTTPRLVFYRGVLEVYPLGMRMTP
ncbi:MAG: hypothetical protein B7Z55_05405 [Planctomycetales bacterium 12-60-4]|nr:MAG: hypothetical protein B7Z55_05405 [Planctomycetales bacterium 12-60-4]